MIYSLVCFLLQNYYVIKQNTGARTRKYSYKGKNDILNIDIFYKCTSLFRTHTRIDLCGLATQSLHYIDFAMSDEKSI